MARKIPEDYRITIRVSVAADTKEVFDFVKELVYKNFGTVRSVRVSPER